MKLLKLQGHARPLSKVIGGRLCAWNPEDGTLLRKWNGTITNHVGRYAFEMNDAIVEYALHDVSVTLDGKYLLAASAEGAFMFDVVTGEQLMHQPLGAVCRSIAWNKKPNGQNRFAVARDSFPQVPAAILVYELPETEFRAGLRPTKLLEIVKFDSKAVGVAWGLFDESLISWHDDGSLNVWDSSTGENKVHSKLFEKRVTSVDFSDDGVLCLCASMDQTAKLLYAHDLSVIQSYTTDRPLNCCSISPLFDREADKRPHILVAGGQNVEDVTKTKATEGKSEAILVHMITEEVLGSIKSHFSPVNSVTFLRDGSGFVTGAEEGNVQIHKFDPSYFTNRKFA